MKSRRRASARALRPVDVDVLGRVLPVVRAQPDHVALVGHHVEELVLPEEAFQRRIAFAFRLAHLDRNGQMVVAGEAEAHEVMGNRWPHPIGCHDVHRLQLPQVEGLVVIGRAEVGFAPIVEIADVVDGDLITRDRGVGQHRHLRLPVAIVAGLDARPQHQNCRAEQGVRADGRPTPPAHEERHDRPYGRQGEANHQHRADHVVARPRILEQQRAPDADPHHQQGQRRERQSLDDSGKQPSPAPVPSIESSRGPHAAISAGRFGCRRQPPERPLDLVRRPARFVEPESEPQQRDEVGACFRIRRKVAIAEEIARAADPSQIAT